ncbi:hypothetical protein Tco_0099214 [Tanacetum coccineum]
MDDVCFAWSGLRLQQRMTVVVPAGICGTRRDCHNLANALIVYSCQTLLCSLLRIPPSNCVVPQSPMHPTSFANLKHQVASEFIFLSAYVSSLYTDLGECAWSCEHCAAMFWYALGRAYLLGKYFERQGTDRDVRDHSMDLSM